MTNYFSSLDEGSTVDTVIDPNKIFHALPAKAIKYEFLRVCPGSCCFLTELSEHEAN